MELRYCPECGIMVQTDEDQVCEICGADTSTECTESCGSDDGQCGSCTCTDNSNGE